LIRNHAEIICYACAFFRYWSDKLGVDKDDILAGAQTLQKQALSIQTSSTARGTLRIEDTSSLAPEQVGDI
jgi:hypothetical protein